MTQASMLCRKDQLKGKGAAYGDIVKDVGRPREGLRYPSSACSGTAGSLGMHARMRSMQRV